MDEEIRNCLPKAKTKAFAIVREGWSRLELDAAGNAKAAELVGKIGKECVLAGQCGR
jgi:hypothetical protein